MFSFRLSVYEVQGTENRLTTKLSKRKHSTRRIRRIEQMSADTILWWSFGGQMEVGGVRRKEEVKKRGYGWHGGDDGGGGGGNKRPRWVLETMVTFVQLLHAIGFH